jgi:polyadenylation factor subunit 2
MQAWPL